MKYDISVQNFHEFTGSKTIFSKKIAFFSPKIGEKKRKMSKSVSGYKTKKKRRKKVASTTKPLV